MKNLFCIVLMSSFVGLFSCDRSIHVNTVDPSEAVMDNIFSRKSVRQFTDRPVEQKKIELLLKAGMAAPSGMDRRPWEFIVVTDRDLLDSFAAGLQNAKMLAGAPMAIIVCGDLERSGYWYLDCSAASQNLLLAAEAMGLGAVWTAAYPYEDRMEVVITALGLPENILPLNVIPVGYPQGEASAKEKFDQKKIHYNGW